MKIKVSVIIPVYNAQRYLRECLESVYKQTLKDIEVIMVNDGSTDGSEEICREYTQKDNRFILINQDNGGSAAARRNGMKNAHGEYMGFVDSDDWTEPDMFEKMYAAASENNADIVFCNCYIENGKTRQMSKQYIRCGYYNREQIEMEILPRTLAGLDEKGRTHVIRWANYLRLYKSEMIRKHEIYNDPRFRRCQDLQLNFEATLYAQSYYYLGDEYLYHNRVVSKSQSRGYTVDCWKKLRILIERLYTDVKGYKKQNLREQMDLCAFFFAVYSCKNEIKSSDKKNLPPLGDRISEICSDPLCEKFISGVPYERLSAGNKLFYNGLKNKDVKGLIFACRYETRTERKRRCISKVLSIKPVLNLYKAIRCEK